MKIKNVQIYQYSIPLLGPLFIPSKKTTKRSGFLIKIFDEKGHFGVGEIAPLPGLHNETLEKTQAQILEIVPKLFSKNFNFSNPLQSINLDFLKFDLFPSVLFGIESAFVNVLSQRFDTSPYELIYGPAHSRIKINGLLSGPQEEVFLQAKKLVAQGYDTLKLKVGRMDINAEIETVKKLRKLVGDKINIRLDGNQNWDYESALYFASAIASQKIEYIEEPLNDPLLLERFYAETGMPFALDESLFYFQSYPTGTRAIILKPSVIGGIIKTRSLVKNALAQNIQPIISSSFESGIGLTMLAHLSSFSSGALAMGLDTWRWLDADVAVPPFNTADGFFELTAQSSSINLNEILLTKTDTKECSKTFIKNFIKIKI